MNALRLKITLEDTIPPVWREVMIPAEFSLAQLHQVVQVAMGWKNSHLHVFALGKRSFSDPEFELDDHPEDERKVHVGELLQEKGASLVYEYDFGDGWLHRILCEEIVTSSAEEAVVRCLNGSQACPPEDSGGPYGYADLLEAREDPDHPGHQDAVDWLGLKFDPTAFAVDAVNRKLSRLFRKGGSTWDYGGRS